MTTGEKVHTALVILIATAMLLSASMMYFFILPEQADDRAIRFVTFLLTALAVVLRQPASTSRRPGCPSSRRSFRPACCS